MASKTTLNAKNLKALGVDRLADLLIEITTGNAAAKRRIRLELAGQNGPDEVAREVRKRLATSARSQSFVDWHKHRALVEDLETQRKAITDVVGPADPDEALELLWRLIDLAPGLYERTDDSSGGVGDVFRQAVCDLGVVADHAKSDPDALAARVFDALCRNDYGQYDGLIETLGPALGESGLASLKARFVDWQREPLPKTRADKDRRIIGYGSMGAIYADELEARSKERTIGTALEQIADAQGDVDGYIAQQAKEAKAMPRVAADIANRLLDAGRSKEALAATDAVDRKRHFGGYNPCHPEWEDARLAALEALGCKDDAQALRWAIFESRLNIEKLRDYLKKLPDFEDIEAERKAISLAFDHPDAYDALSFFLHWPDPGKAAELVLRDERDWNGDLYFILTPASEALADAHPLAATKLLRAMITFSLDEGRYKRYRHAARHLIECKRLAEKIDEFGALRRRAELPKAVMFSTAQSARP
ncbi:hypothetical protein U0C82_18345 [Fulvimarina sp. 2208YS6-2-32]|uniref:Uncharacterized protein n=1 Tax=Fulvimarina uroteuthidis TaxID=3098149 RepID=A0ABU5I7J4_9HYPH|nr:DUF6880 family protein [Fulvimarina sp. 2208YS6-2-32]MDY8111087.1 hypothetical protein [Fulvimarina sp. 2208YS6-2-32]